MQSARLRSVQKRLLSFAIYYDKLPHARHRSHMCFVNVVGLLTLHRARMAP